MSDEENLNLSKYITVTGFLSQHLVIPCVVVVSSITQHIVKDRSLLAEIAETLQSSNSKIKDMEIYEIEHKLLKDSFLSFS